MRSRHVLTLFAGLGVAAVVACTDVPFGPAWNSDFFFPIQFADVALSGLVPGNVIPPVNVSTTAPVDSQTIEGTTKQLLDEDVNSIGADVVFATAADLTGSIQISVSPIKANLFSANPALALTTTIPIRKTAGDTSHVATNIAVFKPLSTGTNGSSNTVLYSQSKTTVACRTAGGCPVSTADKLQLGINLTVNVAVVTRSK